MIFVKKMLDSRITVNAISTYIKSTVLGRKKRSGGPVPSTSFDIKVSGKMNIPGMFYDKAKR